MKAAAIIPAAGSGQRMGGVRKAFLPVAGKPLLQHSLDTLLTHRAIHTIVVALGEGDLQRPPHWLRDPDIILVAGGVERADSVRAGLRALPADIDAVLVHDAARPLINVDLIDRVVAELAQGRCATLAIQATDTLHEVDDALRIRATPDRRRVWRAQTPQVFPRAVLEAAFQKPGAAAATDEAGLVAAAGYSVLVIPGEEWNIKVTTRGDLMVVESAFSGRNA